jgi:hypothetical protein
MKGKRIVTSINGISLHHRLFKTCVRVVQDAGADETMSKVMPVYAKYGTKQAVMVQRNHILDFTLDVDTLRTDPNVQMTGTHKVVSINGHPVNHSVYSKNVHAFSKNESDFDAWWAIALPVYNKHTQKPLVTCELELEYRVNLETLRADPSVKMVCSLPALPWSPSD